MKKVHTRVKIRNHIDMTSAKYVRAIYTPIKPHFILGKSNFLSFDPKRTLVVLDRTASTIICVSFLLVPTMYVLRETIKTIYIFSCGIFNFYSRKNSSIYVLYYKDFVM